VSFKKYTFLVLILVLGMVAFVGLGCEPEDVEEVEEPDEEVDEPEEPEEVAYPERPIDIIVPSGTGGSTDVTARAISAHAHYLDTTTVVSNMPGAAFTIGTQHVADAEPDGYTLLVSTESPIAYGPLAMPEEVEYTLDDLEPVARISLNQFSIAINSERADELGIDDLNDLLDYTEENPGDLTVGYSSIVFDVWREVLLDMGHDLTVVLQDSGGDAAIAAAGGHIDVYFGAWPGIQPFYEDDSVKMLATLPYEFEDDIPSIEEYPEIDEAFGMSKYSVNSVYAPAGTPPEVIEHLEASFEEMFEDEGFTDMLSDQGLIPNFQGHAEFSAEMEEMIEQAQQFEEALATFGE